MGRTSAQRLRVAHLRRVYRETIRNERMFYYDARQYAVANPAAQLCFIIDGATQE